MPVFASIYVFVAVLIIFGPMMMCDYPEMFMHNVEKEFMADDIFETNARIKSKLQKMKKNLDGGNNVEGTELVPKTKVAPVVDPEAPPSEPTLIAPAEEAAKIEQ